MQTLARLFGRSPFAPLQTHMAKVALCVRELVPLFEALEKKDYAAIDKIAAKISKLEHEADLSKNDIRNHLPGGLFMPVAKASLLEILALQDNLADRAEDIAVLLTLRSLEISADFAESFGAFLRKNLEAFEGVREIIQEMGDLLESSFGGVEAEKVRQMVHGVAFKEHECDVMQRSLLKHLYNHCDAMPYPAFSLWMRIVSGVASLADESEKLANRVRMILEVK